MPSFLQCLWICLFMHLWALWCLTASLGEKGISVHVCGCYSLAQYIWVSLSSYSDFCECSFPFYLPLFIFNFFFLKIYFQGLIAAHLLKAPSPFCSSGNRLINGLIHNLQLDLPREILGSELRCLWLPLPSGHLLFSHLSHRNDSPDRGTLQYHNSQRLLNIHCIWLPKVLCQHMVLEPRRFISFLLFASLGEGGVASVGSSVNLIWAPSLLLCFGKGEQRGKTDSAWVL